MKDAVEAISGSFRLGPVATAILPDLLESFMLNDWEGSLIDQCGHGVSARSKGGAVAGLQRAGVVVLERMDSCATIDNQKCARLTPRARDVLRQAGIELDA